MALTDIQARNARAGAKPRKLTDSAGLYLYISITGAKSWRLDYSYAGKRRTLTLGSYPQIGLANARELRDRAKGKLAEGLDPSLAKKREQLAIKAATGNTFGVIADEFIDKLIRDRRAKPTILKNKWMLKVVADKLAPFPITQIAPRDVLAVLTAIEKSGRVETALATRAAIGRVFRYAIATARAENDPTAALRGALQRHVPVSHAALTTREELGGLMRAICGYEGWPPLVAALKIQALCFARPGETRSMEWVELNWNKPFGQSQPLRPRCVANIMFHCPAKPWRSSEAWKFCQAVTPTFFRQ